MSAKYSWEEVAKHNTAESAWVSLNGKVYDVTQFIPNHPGGKEYLLISAGRDCTDLFNSYHPFTKKPDAILPKYQIGILSRCELNSFQPDSGFYKECKEKVWKYFEENNLHPKSPWYGLWRLFFILLTMSITYCLMNSIFEVSVLTRIIAAIIFGSCQGLMLVHQMHDASHSAIGFGPLWWRIIGRGTMEYIAGASMTAWHHQHVLGHHVYTNIMGSDPDLPFLESGDMRYLIKRQIWNQIYQYQHIYMPFLYGLLGIKFRIQDFTWTFINECNGPIRVNPLGVGEWTNHILSKTWFLFYRVFLPLYLFVSWKDCLIYFLISEITTGYFLAFNFQVSHISTECYFPASEKFEKKLKEEWAVNQVMSSLDYAHGDPIATFFSGALNYQTVHHLFPGVSQYHYPAIAPIVLDVCKKYNVPYNVVSSFSEALALHLRYLYEMGNPNLCKF